MKGPLAPKEFNNPFELRVSQFLLEIREIDFLSFYLRLVLLQQLSFASCPCPLTICYAKRAFLCLTAKEREGISFNRKVLNRFNKFESRKGPRTLAKARKCFLKLYFSHMGSEGGLYSSKSTNGGKGLQNSKINSYFTP